MVLEIISPEAILVSGAVTSVSVPGINGEFQMLKNHAPIVSALGKGNVKILKDKNTNETYSIQSGFVEVLNNKVTVLVEGANAL